MEHTTADAVEIIPDPEIVRGMIRESVTRTELLRGLLRLAIRKARDRAAEGREEVARAHE
jgi:hypothetical protein